MKITQQNREMDGVRISTIHSAKGLEAKVVFLLDFSLKIDKAKTKFIWKETENDSLFFIKPNIQNSFSEIEQYINEEYENEEKETLRILYVAMTRAKDILYIVDNKNENGTFKTIEKALSGS